MPPQSGLSVPPTPSSPPFYAGCPSYCNPPNLSWLWTGTKYVGLHKFPQISAACWGCAPNLIHDTFGHTLLLDKWHVDQFSCLCTAYHFTQPPNPTLYNALMGVTPLKSAPPLLDMDPHLTHSTLDPPHSPNKQHLNQFSHFCTDRQMDTHCSSS